MADLAGGGDGQIQVFRTRAVVVAGLGDVGAGTAIVAAGIWLASWQGGRDGLPLGLALMVVGTFTLLTGTARVTARVELSETQVTWRWSFARFRVPLADLEDAALVEKGSPASGSSWAGFLGGGLFGVLALWVIDLAAGFLSSEPTLGPLELMVIKHHGGAVAVKPISAWSTRNSHSEANNAVRAIKKAIDSSARREPSPARQPAALRHDAWDVPGDF
jgi:hypothetical protein